MPITVTTRRLTLCFARTFFPAAPKYCCRYLSKKNLVSDLLISTVTDSSSQISPHLRNISTNLQTFSLQDTKESDINIDSSLQTSIHTVMDSSILRDPAYPLFYTHCKTKVTNGMLTRSVLDAVVRLVEDGSTVPFIVRYRSFCLGGLEASDVFNLTREVASYTTVISSRRAKIDRLRSSGKMTDQLLHKFNTCVTSHDLEVAWAPFKEAKDAKLQAILAVPGLEALAYELISFRRQNFHALPVENLKYSFDDCLQFALAHMIAHDDFTVNIATNILKNKILLSVSKKKTKSTAIVATDGTKGRTVPNRKDGDEHKYLDYENISNKSLNMGFKSNQLLAIRRGSKEGLLSITTSASDVGIEDLRRALCKHYRVPLDSNSKNNSVAIHDSKTASSRDRSNAMLSAIDDAILRLLAPMVCRVVWKNSLEAADESAMQVFCRNLRSLLRIPPLSSYLSTTTNAREASKQEFIVMGVDPGVANGHKVSIVSSLAKGILETSRLHFKVGNNQQLSSADDSKNNEKAMQQLTKMCTDHRVSVIAIGDGVGSRAAQSMIAQTVKIGLLPPSIQYATVSEAGASVYSVSDIAKNEHPGVEVSYLGAVSIARRLIHPLSELVKIAPESLGVGMYQHDLSKTSLEERLVEVIQECVNVGGVDVNSASSHLLKYVAGLNDSRAKAIVAYRELNGRFQSVDEIRKVKGIGTISYKNAAGFLRVYHGGTNVLDATAVHPEHYEIVRKLLRWAANLPDSVDSQTNLQKTAKGKTKQTPSLLQTIDDIGSLRIKKIMDTVIKEFDNCPQDIVELIKQSNDIHSVDSSDRSEVRKVVGDWAKWLCTPVTDSTWVGDVAPGIPPSLRSFESDTGTSVENVVPAVGAFFQGVAKNVVPFGVFVDIGNVDGLLHKSKFVSENSTLKSPSSEGFMCKLSDVVVGMRLPVYITGIKPPNRIELGFSMPREQQQVKTSDDNTVTLAAGNKDLIRDLNEHNQISDNTTTSLSGQNKKKKREASAHESTHKVKKRKIEKKESTM